MQEKVQVRMCIQKRHKTEQEDQSILISKIKYNYTQK